MQRLEPLTVRDNLSGKVGTVAIGDGREGTPAYPLKFKARERNELARLLLATGAVEAFAPVRGRRLVARGWRRRRR